MSRISVFFILLASFGSLSCSRSQPPSPVEAAKSTLGEMLTLAEAGDWGQYIDRFYGESHKFSSAEQRDLLVKRFEEQWGIEVVGALRDASTVDPEIVDGERAVFSIAGEPVFVLHRNASGAWTFHL